MENPQNYVTKIGVILTLSIIIIQHSVKDSVMKFYLEGSEFKEL